MTNPTDCLDSVDTECCDLGSCREPWAWAFDEVRNGPRALRLCERHSDAFMRTELVPAKAGLAAALRKAG